MNDYNSGVPLGDLVIGEESNWYSGISEIRAERFDGTGFHEVAGSLREEPTHIAQYGDGDHLIKRWSISKKGIVVIDDELAESLRKEQARL